MPVQSTEPRYLDPLIDYAFKLLFGVDRSKPHLIDFINALNLFDNKIIDLKFAEREQLGRTVKDRKAVFDVHCVDETGRRFVIELQRLYQPYFRDRSLYYSTFPIQDQAVNGEWDYHLQDTITIGILEFNFDNSHPYPWLHHVGLIDIDTGEVFTDRIRYVYIELPKFTKEEHGLKTRLDWWLYVLKNMSKFEEIPLILREDEVFKSFFMTAEAANLAREQYEAYIMEQKNKWDLYAIKETAEERGEARGRQEATQEKNTAIIKKLLLKGNYSVEEIAEIAEVSIDFVLQIKNTLPSA